MAVDLDVPARYGIRQSVGDTVGPGGINRSLRNIPVLVGVAEDMGKVCPDAWLLNITNPMTCLTRAVCRQTSIKTVGLCHEVGNWSMDLAIALGKPTEAVRPTVAGVNHFPVVTALDVDGEDGFAILAEMVEEAGGLAALAPGPGRPVAEEFSPLDFVQRHALKLTLLDKWGALPGRRRPPHRRVPALGPDRGVGLGGRVQPRADLHRPPPGAPGRLHRRRRRLAGRHQDPPDLGVGRAAGPGHRLPGHRRPTRAPGQHPQRRPGARRAGRRRGRVDLRDRRRRHPGPRRGPPPAALRRAGPPPRGRGRAHRGRRPGGRPALAEAAFFLDPLAGRGDFHQTEAMVDELLSATAAWLPQFAR